MCFSGAGTHRYLQCAINPSIGHELEEKCAIPPRSKKRVLVAGGGVGGMQAALSCAKQGHEVILCEKADILGGVLRCEKNVPFKTRLEEYLDRQALRISRAPITLRLNTEVTPELADTISPDVIIAALGARPTVPPIPGINGGNVFGAEELYYHPTNAGEKLVIIGGGLVGIELGVFMAGRGKKVSIIEVLDELTTDPFGMHSLALTLEIERLGIDVHLGTTVKSISGVGVSCENADGAFALPADTIVYATGQKPLREEAFALSSLAPEFYQIGDCATPRNIMAATREAYTIARNIGRM
jgi:pyruvate/2-oxoglutarate dehydrogenase complex dihydrolipoamide dehydrogenase (E3) component